MTVSSAAEIKTLLSSAPAWRSALEKLYVQVLIAIALGLLLGAVWPTLATEMKPFSDGFITLIRAVVPPIISPRSQLASPRWAICAGSGSSASGRSSTSN
jgi:hypothetical protein